MTRLSPHVTMALSCTSFLALGLITAALGPALPDLAEATSAPLAALGGLISSLFLGALLAQGLAGPLNDRMGPRPVLLGGLTLLALGTAGVILSHSLTLTFALAVMAGLGHGTMDVTLNLLVAQTFPGGSVAALNLLNFFFGAGAVTGPALASLTIRTLGSATPALWAGVALLLAVLPFGWRLSIRAEGAGPLPDGTLRQLVRSPLLWTLGALLLVYVGTENGVGAWATTYMEMTTQFSAATGALVTAGFWGALTVGRIFAALAGTRIAPGRLLLWTMTGATAGGVVVALGIGSAPVTVAGILLLGFFFGPVFPTTLALTTSAFPEGTGTAASIAVALGSVGGMLLPPLQGYVQEAAGPGPGMLIVTVASGVMLVLSAGYRRFSQSK